MTRKEMNEMARKAFEQKNGSTTTEYIETVGNKGVEHTLEFNKKEEDEEEDDYDTRND